MGVNAISEIAQNPFGRVNVFTKLHKRVVAEVLYSKSQVHSLLLIT